MKANGNAEISQASINISEEVNKSGIWTLVNRGKNKKRESLENNTYVSKWFLFRSLKIFPLN
jgi:hypothetical protein